MDKSRFTKPENALTLLLRSSDRAEEHVRLSGLAEILRLFSQILENVSESFPDGPRPEWRISHSRAGSFEIGAVPIEDGSGSVSRQHLARGYQWFESIQTHGKRPEGCSDFHLRNLRVFSQKTRTLGYRTHLSLKNQRLDLETRFDDAIVRLLAPERRHPGSVLGTIRAFGARQGERPWTFGLETNAGDRIKCRFEPNHDLLMTVYECFRNNRYVRVHGDFPLAPDEIVPKRMRVERIEILDRSRIPDLNDLFGSAPGITGGLSVVDFLREQRGDG